VIADRTDHARLDVVESDMIGEAADVQFGVVITVRIAAIDEHMVSTETPHVGEPHGLVVEY
jgi:hypothetical protein